jgi:cytochrome b involved in lipid metabolism
MGDVNMVVGMKFPGPISKNESRTFKFFFGCADTKELLAESIRNSMLGLSIEKNENKNPLVVRIFPLPADDKLNLAISNLIGDATIYVSNVIGESVLEAQFVQFNGGEYLISKNIDSLPGGFYIVRIVAGSEVFLRSFIKK